MKKYMAPELEIAKFSAEDIITVSGVIERIAVSSNPDYQVSNGANTVYTYGNF